MALQAFLPNKKQVLNWLVIFSYTTRKIPYVGFLINRLTLIQKIKNTFGKGFEHRHSRSETRPVKQNKRQIRKEGQEMLARLKTVQKQYEESLGLAITKTLPAPLLVSKLPLSSQLEAEVIKKCCEYFQGTQETCGMITPGFMESILTVYSTYSEFAKDKHNNLRPEIIVPSTIQDGFLKAAFDINLKPTVVAVDPKTQMMDLTEVEKAINPNTILIVASAVSRATGMMDDLAGLAHLSKKSGIGLHIDASMTNLLLSESLRNDIGLPTFDFSLEGVTSLVINTNRDYKPDEGPFVLLFRNRELAQYHITPSFTQRPDNVAKAWASVTYHDSERSTEVFKQILNLKDTIVAGIQGIEGLEVIGQPKLGIIAFRSNTLNTHLIAKKMKEKAWPIELSYKPKGFNICLTKDCITRFEAQKFLNDLKDCVDHVRAYPLEQFIGNVILYGMMCKKDQMPPLLLDNLEGGSYEHTPIESPKPTKRSKLQ